MFISALKKGSLEVNIMLYFYIVEFLHRNSLFGGTEKRLQKEGWRENITILIKNVTTTITRQQ